MHGFQSFVAVVFIFLAVDVAAACSCVPSRSPCNYYGGASAIFVGRAVGAAQQKSVVDENGNKTTFDVGTIRFLVLENFKGYDMTLPPRLSQREVKVTVVWPDGRPAVGVMVYYEMNDVTDLGDRAETDTKGRASVTLFDNYHYIIYATVERNGKDVHATPVEVFVDKSLKPLRFVLSKDGYGLEEREKLKRKYPN